MTPQPQLNPVKKSPTEQQTQSSFSGALPWSNVEQLRPLFLKYRMNLPNIRLDRPWESEEVKNILSQSRPIF
jgi:hypothetical protein